MSTNLIECSRHGASGVTKSYDIDNSLRFNDDDSPHFSKTPSTDGNLKTWSWSCWVKRAKSTGTQSILGVVAANCGDYVTKLQFNGSGQLNFDDWIACGAIYIRLTTTQVFRDTNAWYHIVVVVDTTQSTASNRAKMYVNGEQVTDFITETYPSVNHTTYFNSAIASYIGRDGDPNHLDGYLAEVNFIDGQSLTPSDFGESGKYGEWKPIEYKGTYGNNGFYLDFKTSGTLGNDASSNSNNWTVNNLAATDQMVDTPTNNFCTLNPLDINSDGIGTLSEGNLKMAGGTWDHTRSTYYLKSGKWYWECLAVSTSTLQFGVVLTNYAGGAGRRSVYQHNATKYSGGSSDGSYGATFTNGDIIGVSLDLSTGTITFYKNNVSQGAAYTDLLTAIDGQGWTPATIVNNSTSVFNFGQDSSFAGNKTAQGNQDGNEIGDFYYAPPTGFLALCTKNLPDPTVIPSEHFNTVTYTGNGSTQSITGVGFQPDFLWVKDRTVIKNHRIFDTVRGSTILLSSNNTDAEATNTGTLTSFDSDGFSLGSNNAVNDTNDAYVAWNWKAGGTAVSNTNGSITSSVSANVDAGFSIVSYTGTGTNGATVGHGLSKIPEMVITKNRDTTSYWMTNHDDLDNVGYALYLNVTDAVDTTAGMFTTLSSSLMTLGTQGNNNGSTNKIIAYAFHSVDGYSKVGSYVGNGSADGTFVHTGFRPAYVLFRRYDTSSSWAITDSGRNPYNVANLGLSPNDSGVEETTSREVDFLSNGFKHRQGYGERNASGGSYIFLAFAEQPFKHSNAR